MIELLGCAGVVVLAGFVVIFGIAGIGTSAGRRRPYTGSAETPGGGVTPRGSAVSASPAADPTGGDTAPPPVPVAHARPHEPLELLIGGRWLLYLGMASLLIGLGFFVKYAVDHAWITEPIRVAAGVALGVAMVIAGDAFSRRGYTAYGHAVAGGGFVVVYLATWWARHLYDLVPPITAFAATLCTTGTALWMSYRLNAKLLAVIAVIGGFLSPALAGWRVDAWWLLVVWAAEAAALYWAGAATGREGLRVGGGVALVLVAARLLDMNVFGGEPGFVAFWNPRAGAGLAVILAASGMTWAFRSAQGGQAAHASREYAALVAGAHTLSVLLLSAEINAFWRQRDPGTSLASFRVLASLSVAWAAYGTALLVAGIMQRYAQLRLLAIGLLLLTVAKVFVIDLNVLGGLYRIVGFVGLGVCLLFGSWLYQRYRQTILESAN